MTTLLFGFVLGWVFLLAALPKLVLRAEFEKAVQNYELLPDFFVKPVALGLPWLELVLSLGFFLGLASVAAALAIPLLVVFVVAVTANLLAGKRIECGCAGAAAPRRISWYLVGKNAVLAATALLVAVHSDWIPSVPLTGVDAVALIVASGLIVISETLAVESLEALRVAQTTARTFEEWSSA